MRIVRAVAVYRKGGEGDKNYKFVVVCGIDGNQRLADGEWMGYIQNESVFWPFILRNGVTCFYGGEEHNAEPTNIGSGVIENGRFFTVSSPPGEYPSSQFTYEIVSCHPYDD